MFEKLKGALKKSISIFSRKVEEEVHISGNGELIKGKNEVKTESKKQDKTKEKEAKKESNESNEVKEKQKGEFVVIVESK